MKKYSQVALRDREGDIVISQFAEVTRVSGLILPQHISTVTVASDISTKMAVDLMDIDEIFHYEPDLSKFHRFPIAPAPKHRQTLRFSIEPQDRHMFCKLSSRTIADAYHALTFMEIRPNLDFTTVQSLDELPDDDHAMFKEIVQGISDILAEVDTTAPVSLGQYL